MEMSKKIPLQHIIEMVLKEKKIPSDDSNIQNVRRRFYTLLESIGGNKEALKAGGRKVEFDELELPFIKVIIRQLYDRKGLIANLLDEKSDISSIDIRNLIQSIIDEENRSGASEDELVQLGLFLQKLFNCWQLYSLENCHTIINALYANMSEMTCELQTLYMSKVEHILKKEYKLRMVELAYGVRDISQIIEFSKNEKGNEIGIQSYTEYDPEIRKEYIERDRHVLKAIQDDDDLRDYIEKKIGKKAEEIFNYADLSENT